MDAIDRALDDIVKIFIDGVIRARASAWFNEVESGIYLAALFDLCATGLYTNGLQKSAEFVSDAVVCDETQAFFPLTWMCPHCVAKGKPLDECYLPDAVRKAEPRGSFPFKDYPRVERLAKPGGRAIGDFGIKILKAILRGVFLKTAPEIVMRDGGGIRGEFDLTFASEQHLIFGEVKAKPLIVYPLRIGLSAAPSLGGHRWHRISARDAKDMTIYLAASDYHLPITPPTVLDSDVWPLPQLATLLGDPNHLETIVQNWKLHLDRYRAWVNEPRDTRWHRFGCGNFSVREDGVSVEKRVANTKELPGLDRTDDVKKGMAQLLRFARYKHDCPQRAISCVLIGNTHAETHAAEYVDPVVTLKIMRDGQDTHPVWLFDAIIGFTRNDINNPGLHSIFDLSRVFRQ
ncbi:hypothetical protein [Sphingomonas sp. LR55]|uniref:hypothetical protein n=1 Tax=Sphingomonas sp. LR55 TaxID=3050231 RepID=UPI002FDF9266